MFIDNSEIASNIVRQVAVNVPSFDIKVSMDSMKAEYTVFQKVVADYVEGNPDISDEDAFTMIISIKNINESIIENDGLVAALDKLNIKDVAVTNFFNEVVENEKFVSVNMVTDLLVKTKQADPENFNSSTFEIDIDAEFFEDVSGDLSVDKIKKAAEAISNDADLVSGLFFALLFDKMCIKISLIQFIEHSDKI